MSSSPGRIFLVVFSRTYGFPLIAKCTSFRLGCLLQWLISRPKDFFSPTASGSLFALIIHFPQGFPYFLPSNLNIMQYSVRPRDGLSLCTSAFSKKRLACLRFQHYSIKVTHIDALLYYFCGSYHSAPVSNLPNYQIRPVLIFYVLQ